MFRAVFHDYAKSHSLSFDELEFYSTKSLNADDTPATVNLQKGDVIFVRKRQKVPSKSNETFENSEEAQTSEGHTEEGKNIPDEEGDTSKMERKGSVADELIPNESQDTVSNAEQDKEFVANGETTTLTAEKDSVSEQASAVVDLVFENAVSEVAEAMIEENDEKSSGTSEEWDLVDDENVELGSDEALARAAQMVGSALFEEDINKSDVSMLTASDQTNISLALMTRWQNELTKLHEIGFYDDKKSIDVLEELEAANIGVDSSDPVEFEKVVDKLLNSSNGVNLF